MSTKVWGPKLWYVLHVMTFKYPEFPNEYDKRHYHDFFTNLQYVLPCMKCRLHYRQNLEKYPLTPNLDSREYLVRWLINIHNEVNLVTGKPIKSYQEVLTEYKNEMLNPNVTKNNNGLNLKFFKYIFIVLIIISIIYYIYNYLSKRKRYVYISRR